MSLQCYYGQTNKQFHISESMKTYFNTDTSSALCDSTRQYGALASFFLLPWKSV